MESAKKINLVSLAVVMCLVTYTFAVSNAEQVGNRKFMTMDPEALLIGRPAENCASKGQPCGSLVESCCDHLYCTSYFQGTCVCISEGEPCGYLHICCEGLSCTGFTAGKCIKVTENDTAM